MSDFVVEPRVDTLRLLGLVVASHKLLRVIGDGGMGTVYEGEHEILGERRAIKVCKVYGSTAAKQRAVNEAKMMAKLRHPGICTLFDVQWGPPDGTSPVMVMELLQGHTFFDEIAAGPADWRRVVSVACDVLEALEYAHQQGIIHRDIKPENVFIATVNGKQATKTMDFGIGKLQGVSATKTGQQMGTPHYMSPEQITNAKSVDGRADIYSVAAMLYRGTTGQYVFPRGSAAEIMFGHLNEEPQRVRALMPTIPESLAMAIHRGLAKSREQRFASAAEMRFALQRCLEATDGAIKADAQAPTLSPTPVPVPVELERTAKNVLNQDGNVQARTVQGSSGKVATVQLGEPSGPQGMSSTARERYADERLRSFVGGSAARRSSRTPMLILALLAALVVAVGIAVWATFRTPPASRAEAPVVAAPAAPPALEVPKPATVEPAPAVPAATHAAPEPASVPKDQRTTHRRSSKSQPPAKESSGPKTPAAKDSSGIITGVFDDK